MIEDSSIAGVAAVAAGGLRVLTADSDAPIVAEAAVEAATLHALHVFAQGLVQEVGILLASLALRTYSTV